MTGPLTPTAADRSAMQTGDSRGFTQRWRYGTPTWRHVSEGGFRADRYEVTGINEADAKAFVQRHHYLSGWPAVLHRFGLLDREAALHDDDIAVDGSPLVGVLVLAVPMNMRVLTNPFPHLVPLRESAEIARLVLTEAVPSNGESFFTAAALRRVAADGLKGAVMFSDPVPRWRLTEKGKIIQTRGHLGIVYQSLSAVYTGRGTARTLTVLPDGTTLTARARSKLLRQESGALGVARRLERLGAPPRPAGQPLAVWLDHSLAQIGAERLPHPGNHRYILRVGRTRAERTRTVIGLKPQPYPKNVPA
ncbi:hypothetical protein OG413_44630 [Streptomyces sp. NBC_01433]|uniref:Mom family adenine methylcarbamoylation protein n=1 Tax=Streptomyces sp. NBC_01433 TaxID=2903864 RepID=UPI00224D85A5|nr:hypothetical protein [Streptomyces sp. NBC_01433]MCX4682271.1 hypothetical protein [Streptomyces sp. NBC_01433]